MRKPLIFRIFLFAAVYCAAFLAVAYVQFAGQNTFTLSAGNLVVQGRYIREAGKRQGAFIPGRDAVLNGGISVFFGGMEFDFGRIDKKNFALASGDSGIKPAEARSLTLSDNGIMLRLKEGPDISVITQYNGGVLELVLEAVFPEPETQDGETPETGNAAPYGERYAALHIPYTPLSTSKARDNGSSFMITAGGMNYAFTRTAGTAHGIIRLEPENSAISYRAIPERRMVNPQDFILASAKDAGGYENALNLWKDKSYSAWNKTAGSPETAGAFSSDGDMISAYMSEALKRGTYRAASSALSAVYVPGANSWKASAYTGKLDTAFRFSAAAERERYAQFARFFREKSADFLKDFHVIDYLNARGYASFLEDAVEILRNFDPAVMTLEQSAGFLEGYFDWEAARPETYNPFTRSINQAFFVVSGGLKKNSLNGIVLVFTGQEADIELNLRLGASLIRFADETWQEVGRSLILSALSLTDSAGSAPRIVLQNDGAFTEKPETARLSPAGMYRILDGGGYYARAAEITISGAVPGQTRSGLWAWTASTPIRAVETSAALDIELNFPAGETHYLMIRGVKPFVRLQFYGIDQASDPQFERYDASGWVYLPQEQALLVKMKHRSMIEHIRLLQTFASPPAVETTGETE